MPVIAIAASISLASRSAGRRVPSVGALAGRGVAPRSLCCRLPVGGWSCSRPDSNRRDQVVDLGLWPLSYGSLSPRRSSAARAGAIGQYRAACGLTAEQALRMVIPLSLHQATRHFFAESDFAESDFG